MLAENVSYGSVDPIEAIILMLIDDGDPENRVMRSNILDPTHRFIGMAQDKHKN